MRIKAMTVRILKQLMHDKRTLALMLAAPLLLLTLIYFIFDADAPSVSIGVINAPENYVENLYDQNLTVLRYLHENEAQRALEQGDIVAVVNIISGKVYVRIDGTTPAHASAALSGIEAAKQNIEVRSDLKSEITYVYGAVDLSMFDNFGSTLIGFLVFFFVFLVAGIAFLQERTSGTLERLLSTPIRRWELITGYVLGYGVVTIVQATLISFYVIYVLNVIMMGSIWLVLLITLLSAMCALTLGILLSTAANNEFQMVQFIPIVIVPQLFFSGLFDLSPGWMMFGRVMPLYYVADALNDVMMRGKGLIEIMPAIAVLIGCSILFMFLNTLLLKKYRRI